MSVGTEALGQTPPRRDYVFSAMSWLSVVVISCWVGWLLGSGCSISSLQDQRSSADLPPPRTTALSGAAAGVAFDESRESTALRQGGHVPFVEGTLADAVQILSGVSDEPVVLSAEAESIAHCPAISVPGPDVDAAETRRLLRSAIEASGFTIDRDDTGERVTPARDILFLGCRSKRQLAQPSSRELQALEGSVRLVGEREREMPRDLFVKLGLLSRTSPNQERVVPYYRDGAMLGVKVYTPGGNRGILEILGFEDGDVITHVAGQPLLAPSSAIRIPTDPDKFVVRVLRGGVAMDLQYELVDSPSS